MGLAPTRRPARTISTAELATMLGLEGPEGRRKAYRRIKRLYETSPGPWLSHGNGLRGNRHFRINLSLLRAAHPGFFDAPSVEDVEESLDALREENVELRASLRALGSKYRDLSRRVSALEARRAKATTSDDEDDGTVRPFGIAGDRPDPHHGLPPGWSNSR